MDIDDDSMNAMGKFDGNCRTCGTYGHKAAQCRKGKGKDAKDKKKCYRCDRDGHFKRDCIAKTKANGDKITGSNDKKKVPGKEKFDKKKACSVPLATLSVSWTEAVATLA